MARKKRALNAEESDEFVTPRTLIEQVLQPGENEKTVRRQRRKTRESSKVTSSPVRGSTGILALETVKAATAVKAIANTSLVTPRTALQNVLETQDVIKTVMPATRQRKIVSQSAEPSSDNIADQNEVEQMIDNEIEKVTRESNLKNSKQVELGSSALDEYRQNLHEKLAKFKQPIGHSRLISSTITADFDEEPMIENITPVFNLNRTQTMTIEETSTTEIYSQKLREKLEKYRNKVPPASTSTSMSDMPQVIVEATDSSKPKKPHQLSTVDLNSKEVDADHSVHDVEDKDAYHLSEDLPVETNSLHLSPEVKKEVDIQTKDKTMEENLSSPIEKSLQTIDDVNEVDLVENIKDQQKSLQMQQMYEIENVESVDNPENINTNVVNPRNNEMNVADAVASSLMSEQEADDPLNLSSFYNTQHDNTKGSASMSDPSLVLHRIPETLVEALMMSQRKSKVEELQLRTSVLKPKSKVVVPSMRKLLTTEQSNKATKSVGRKLPVPSNQIRDIVQHHCSNKLTKGAVEVIEVSFEKFFKYLCRDVMAICLHAGRKIVTQADIELVMKRQRFIKDNKSLQILIEQNFPLEYRQLFIPVASSVTLKQRKKK